MFLENSSLKGSFRKKCEKKKLNFLVPSQDFPYLQAVTLQTIAPRYAET